MKYIILLLNLIAMSSALSACAMDTTGGFYQGGETMNGKPIYEPGDIP